MRNLGHGRGDHAGVNAPWRGGNKAFTSGSRMVQPELHPSLQTAAVPAPAWLAGAGGQGLQGEEYVAVFYLELKAGGAAMVWRQRFAGGQVDLPAVQRAGHGLAKHNAL